MELKKSKLLLATALIGGIVFGTASFAAETEQVEDLSIAEILNKIKSMLPDADAQYELCKKGDAMKGKFSLRSGRGVACKLGPIGAIASVLCPGIEDYESSGCFKNNTYKDAKSGAAALKSAIKAGGSVGTFLCDNKEKLPGKALSNLAESACAEAEAVRRR